MSRSGFSRVIETVKKLLAGGAFLIAIYAGYSHWMARTGGPAKQFCDGISAGLDLATALERAGGAGLDVVKRVSHSDGDTLVLSKGGDREARCTIRVIDGRVRSANFR